MPFLEHLEDLRKTIVRILITLIIGVGVSFVFKNDLMELIRRPIDGVWSLQLNTALHKLPRPIDASLWERCTKAAADSTHLSPEQRTYFYETLASGNPDFIFHTQSIGYYRSALAVSGSAAQLDYIQGLPNISAEMREQLTALLQRYQESGGLAPDPAADTRRRLVFMQSLHPTEGFMLSFKLALYAGIALTLPVLLYFILQFVLPGLHKKERKVLYPALVIGFGLFFVGAVFAYAVVLPRALEFFSTYSGGMGISNDWRIGDYLSFTTQFVLIFGLAFELPVIVMALVVLDFLSYSTMAKSRSYAIIAILITAAVITPTPDAITLGLLAVPMYLLYEICIWLAWGVERNRRKKDALQRDQEEQEAHARIEQLKQQLRDQQSTTPLSPHTPDASAVTKPVSPDTTPLVASAPSLISYDDIDCEEEDTEVAEEDLQAHLAEYEEEQQYEYQEQYECEGGALHTNELADAQAKINAMLEDLRGESPADAPLDVEALEGGGGALNPDAEAEAAGGAPDDDDEEENLPPHPHQR